MQSYLYDVYRGPLWGAHYDYPQATGHGIGSFLSVRECKFYNFFLKYYKAVSDV